MAGNFLLSAISSDISVKNQAQHRKATAPDVVPNSLAPPQETAIWHTTNANLAGSPNRVIERVLDRYFVQDTKLCDYQKA
jgi:hypothetical protein